MINYEALLQELNPHWREKTSTMPLSPERDLTAVVSKQIKENRLIKIIDGPRRIGKTHLLRQQIAKLIKLGISPQNICYIQFETTMNKPMILNTFIDTWHAIMDNGDEKQYVFLDEIQLIDFWQDQVKHYYDLNDRYHFIITGSTSLFSRVRSHESLLGRFEKFHLSGLTFIEYLRFAKVTHMIKPYTFKTPVTPSDKVAFLHDYNKIHRLFRQYLERGEYPELVIGKDSIDPTTYLRDIVQTLIDYDLPYLYPGVDRAVLRQLLHTIATLTASEFSYSNIAADFSVDRREIIKYIDLLEEAHLIHIGLNGYFRKIRTKLIGSKKIYMKLANLTLSLIGADQIQPHDSYLAGRLVESYVANRLSSRFTNLEYYRTPKGEELDFVTDAIGIEIKTGQIKDKDMYIALAKKIKKRLFIINDSLYEETADYTAIPFYLL